MQEETKVSIEEKLGLESDVIVSAGPAKGRLASLYRTAQIESDDPRTKNAAAIYAPHENSPIATGANEFPDVRLVKEARTRPPLKYQYIVHAERNAIFNAWNSKKGIPKNSTLVCPWLTCDQCAQVIIKAGISRVVGHYDMVIRSPARWHGELKLGLDMLREVGVRIEWYKGEVFSRSSDFRYTFNGEEITV